MKFVVMYVIADFYKIMNVNCDSLKNRRKDADH